MISVIVPVYKVEQYLPQCIDSILNQTYRDIEIILIDDGSPDACGKICDIYAGKDKRIKTFHKNHGGLSETRNYGIIKSSGEYLAFVDSDDWIEPDMYEELINVAKEHQAEIVCSGFFYEYPDRTEIATVLDKKYVNNIDLVKSLINGKINIHAWNKLYHKTVFNEVSFLEGRVYEDVLLMHNIFLKVPLLVCISKPLYHYRKNRKGAITLDMSMENLINDWLAHKSRYDFFLQDNRFNTDKEIMDKLLYYYCASTIMRVLIWYHACSDEEKEQYGYYLKDIQEFYDLHFPVFSLKKLPLRMRPYLFLGRFNNKIVSALLYYMFQCHKKLSNCRLIRKLYTVLAKYF